MSHKKITVHYEDSEPEIVTFRLSFEELPLQSGSVEHA
jgi:hypothetical protein